MWLAQPAAIFLLWVRRAPKCAGLSSTNARGSDAVALSVGGWAPAPFRVYLEITAHPQDSGWGVREVLSCDLDRIGQCYAPLRVPDTPEMDSCSCGGIGIRAGLKRQSPVGSTPTLSTKHAPGWLMETGTPTGLRNQAFVGSNPTSGTAGPRCERIKRRRLYPPSASLVIEA